MADVFSILTGNFVNIESQVTDLIPKLGAVCVILAVGFIIIKIAQKMISKFFDKVKIEYTIKTFLEKAIGIIFWAVLITTILGTLGVDLTGILAGFGIMGFIIGFALKDTLSNLAAGLFILFFKPFKIGDWVEVSGVTGKVKILGIAATTFRTTNNTKVTIPNAKIWSSAIKNLTALKKLRKEFVIPVSHAYNIKEAIKVIKKLLDKDERILKEPSPDVFVSKIDRFVSYITVKPMMSIKDYWPVRNDLSLNIIEALKKAGIKMN